MCGQPLSSTENGPPVSLYSQLGPRGVSQGAACPRLEISVRVPPALAPKVECERVNLVFPKSHPCCPCHQLRPFSLDSDGGSKSHLRATAQTHGDSAALSLGSQAAGGSGQKCHGATCREFGDQGPGTVDIK